MTTIFVTQADIDEGIRKDCVACPVVRAINRHLGVCQPGVPYEARLDDHLHIGFARVYQGVDEFINQAVYYGDSCPRNVVLFVRGFDAGEPVGPFRFDIDIPERLLKTAA